MNNNIIINKEGNFKDETISSIPMGINNIILETNETNMNLRNNDFNNIKPMLSSNSNTIRIPDGKRVKIKPFLNKKVPVNTFAQMANPKKNMGGNNSDNSSDGSVISDGSDESNGSDGSNESNSNAILSNKSNGQRQQQEEEDTEEDPDDYTSIESNVNRNNNDEDDEEEEDDGSDGSSILSVQKKQKTYEEIQQEKQKLLFNLERLQKQGYPPSKKYSMASSFEDMQFEHDRLKKQRDVEKSIKFSRKILMALVSGIEFLNGKFDPFDVKLEGWSENVMENVADYDEVFEELHDKYGESVKMAPELKLIAMLAGSGFMFHLTNSLFKTASPKLSDILKQNPDIMRNISEAAAKNMGNTINQEFGQDDVIGNLMKGGINMKMQQQAQQAQHQQNNSSQQRGPSGPMRSPGPKLQQTKMNGPVGIDELLNELNGGNHSNTMRDDVSVSSGESVTIKSSAKRTKNGKKGGIQLDLR
jgi:hypothetical protein